ncbi:MAG: hypothetical protein V7711_09095 [Pseudomonadales bacterium]
MSDIAMGPALTGTLVCRDIALLESCYVDYLYMQVVERSVISHEQASLWAAPALAGNAQIVLASSSGVPWIRAIEDPAAAIPRPFLEQGWMTLEVVVKHVDALAVELESSPFEIFRPPADLDVSPMIRAMQVIGPAGEVLYLTEVKGDVPPFDIPQASCEVDRLFIPVMCCQDRDASIDFYTGFSGVSKFVFDTKITSVNAAYGYELDRRHPVATMQLAGQSMIEIDQIEACSSRPCANGGLPAGIAMISYEVDSLDDLSLEWLSQPQVLQLSPYAGRRAAACVGAGGELLELIERH